jgi:hypothetical protein
VRVAQAVADKVDGEQWHHLRSRIRGPPQARAADRPGDLRLPLDQALRTIRVDTTRMISMKFRIHFIAAVLAFVSIAQAQENAARMDSVELSGVGSTMITLKPETLSGLPAIEQDVSFKTSKGISSGHYKGVLFWEVLKANKAFDGLGHNSELAKTFIVIGRDDYRIAFSVGEIHPEFGNTPMMIATEVDGKPFADGLRVIVPGDQRGARNVREVVKIEVH